MVADSLLHRNNSVSGKNKKRKVFLEEGVTGVSAIAGKELSHQLPTYSGRAYAKFLVNQTTMSLPLSVPYCQNQPPALKFQIVNGNNSRLVK
jgi:hypothetical protein